MTVSTPMVPAAEVTGSSPAVTEATPTAWPERLARWSWRLLLGAVIGGLVGGAVVAIASPSGGEEGLRLLPYQLQAMAYAVATLLALPGLLAGVWDCLRGRWGQGARRLLTFAGPVAVFFANELGSHLLVPCGLTESLGWGTPDWGPSPCPGGMHPTAAGRQVFERIHQLHHTLLAGAPVAAIYWLALRRWHRRIIASR